MRFKPPPGYLHYRGGHGVPASTTEREWLWHPCVHGWADSRPHHSSTSTCVWYVTHHACRTVMLLTSNSPYCVIEWWGLCCMNLACNQVLSPLAFNIGQSPSCCKSVACKQLRPNLVVPGTFNSQRIRSQCERKWPGWKEKQSAAKTGSRRIA